MKTAVEEIRQAIAQLEKSLEWARVRSAELNEKVAELKSKASKLTATERIRVPENIKFEEHPDNLLLALISPNGKCMLSADDMHGGIPLVCEAGYRNNAAFRIITDPLYLEPCKREDLRCGDVAFCCEGIDNVTPLSSNIAFYVCILNESDHVFWYEGMGIRVSDMYWSDWYKVVR